MDTDTKTVQDVIEMLEYSGYNVMRYSGRFMYGKHCVGVSLEKISELFGLGALLSDAIGALPNFRYCHTDSLGLGIVAYWPKYEWPADVPDPEDSEDSEDED